MLDNLKGFILIKKVKRKSLDNATFEESGTIC